MSVAAVALFQYSFFFGYVRFEKKKTLKQFAERGGSVNNTAKQELQDYCRSASRHTDKMAKCRRPCYNMHVAKLATHDMDTDYWRGNIF